MINQPTTPPMALMSIVMMLMGIGGLRTRFVRNMSTTPTIALTMSAGNASSPIPVTSRTTSTNITTMSTTISTKPTTLHQVVIVLYKRAIHQHCQIVLLLNPLVVGAS